jgi:hypothetical protein
VAMGTPWNRDGCTRLRDGKSAASRLFRRGIGSVKESAWFCAVIVMFVRFLFRWPVIAYSEAGVQ